jgi:hypothetical protein
LNNMKFAGTIWKNVVELILFWDRYKTITSRA